MTYQTTIIGAVISLSLVMAAIIAGLSVAGRLDAQNTPLIVTVISTLATTTAALVSLLRTDRAVEVVNRTNGDVLDLTARMGSTEAKVENLTP